MYHISKLFRTDDAGYQQILFWLVDTREDALAQARQILDRDPTGRVAINITQEGGPRG